MYFMHSKEPLDKGVWYKLQGLCIIIILDRKAIQYNEHQ